MDFYQKLTQAIATNQTLLCLELDPDLEDLLPDPTAIDSLATVRDWLLTAIAQSAEWVCAYRLSLGYYQAWGAAGLDLLQTVLQAIPPHLPTILDAKYADLETSTLFASTAFATWQVDAVTLSPYAGQDQVAPFLVYADKAVFVLCVTTNPSAAILQAFPQPDQAFYLHLVQEAQNWGPPEQLGLEVTTMTPTLLEPVRAIAPERLILSTGTDCLDRWRAKDAAWMQGLVAGLDANGENLLISIPPDLLLEPTAQTTIQDFRQAVNQVREQRSQNSPSCQVWLPDVCLVNPQPHQDLILQLYDIGCILFGEYVQASGATFPYYIDLRKIISQPQIFHQVVSAYATLMKPLQFDRIAGIPYGSLPIATGLALHLHYPMIYPRKEVKAHGTRRMVEGHFQAGETIVVVDDILISGKSAITGAQKLQSTGLVVNDIVVLIDHERGVKERLQAAGYHAHAVMTLTEIAETLYNSSRITISQYEAILASE
ncbi:bifunctional orotidine-5'-phosphate decarboxylase/orotate phosphoribosyltransferase [Trichothermofontia sp.]